MTVRVEKQTLIAQGHDERTEVVTFAAHSSYKTSIIFTYCSKSDHVSSECFKLIGYPKSWGEKQKIGQSSGRGYAGRKPLVAAAEMAVLDSRHLHMKSSLGS